MPAPAPEDVYIAPLVSAVIAAPAPVEEYSASGGVHRVNPYCVRDVSASSRIHAPAPA